MFGNRVKTIVFSIAGFASLSFAMQSAAIISPAARMISLSETKYFKNWAAGCDNVLSCQAIALRPVDVPDGYLSLVITRDGKKSSAISSVELLDFDTDAAGYKILADDKLVTAGVFESGKDSITLKGAVAAKVVRAVAAAKEFRITDDAGKLLGRISPNGAAAALKYLDGRQRRSGKQAAAKTLPQIPVKSIKPTEIIPETSDLIALAESSICVSERSGVTEDSAYSLGNQDGKPAALALISCGNGAYNFSSVAFIGTRGEDKKWKFVPAIFNYISDDPLMRNSRKKLTNATWNPAKQNLNSYYKGRVIADCGETEDFVWDGYAFRLTRAERMKECQGSPVWITVWRAAVEFAS